MEIVGNTGRKGLGIHSLALGSVQILRDPLSDAPGIHVLSTGIKVPNKVRNYILVMHNSIVFQGYTISQCCTCIYRV